MSRLGKLPIIIPANVEVKISTDSIVVKGPNGIVAEPLHNTIKVEIRDNHLHVMRADETRTAREQHGLRRSLFYNAIVGVSSGFKKDLEVIGVGYKVNLQGDILALSVGFSHAVNFKLPSEVTAKIEGNKILLSSHNKQLLGETAARIRRIRPPEPYKGKGIKYSNEHIRRKAGKSGKSGK